MVGFESIDSSFRALIGPHARLRKLLKQPDGEPLFHEAGVLMKDVNGKQSVLITSNRLPCPKRGQCAKIVTLPVEALPPAQFCTKGNGAAANGVNGRKDFDDLAQGTDGQELSTHLKIEDEASYAALAMSNGACPWPLADGTTGALICAQGRHSNDATDDVHAALVAWSPAGEHAVLLDRDASGRPFTSLNDAVIHEQSGCVFFTDPRYGIEQGFKRKDGVEYAPSGLYVWNPQTGDVVLLDDRYDKVNGVTFVPDPSDPCSGRGILFTTDTGRFSFSRCSAAFDRHDMGALVVEPTRPACIYAYPVEPSSCSGKMPRVCIDARRLFAESEAGVPDGIHRDERGNVWVGHGDGVHVYRPRWEALLHTTAVPDSNIATFVAECDEKPTGELIGKIVLPAPRGVANFCWAGPAASKLPSSNGPLYRLLLFAEDELWEALVAVNGYD